jgi:hypothetical protein
MCNRTLLPEIIPILHYLTKAHKLQDHKQYPNAKVAKRNVVVALLLSFEWLSAK